MEGEIIQSAAALVPAAKSSLEAYVAAGSIGGGLLAWAMTAAVKRANEAVLQDKVRRTKALRNVAAACSAIAGVLTALASLSSSAADGNLTVDALQTSAAAIYAAVSAYGVSQAFHRAVSTVRGILGGK